MTKKFTHNKKEFEIRKGLINGEHCVRVFHNGKPVGPTYSVSQDIENDYQTQHGKSMIDELENTAQSDIERGLYIS